VDVTVATGAGTSSLSSADHYSFDPTPAISSFSPFSDTATGGVPITIIGSGFTGATAVDFGNTVVTSFTVNSDTSLTVIAPANTVGNLALTVVGPGGQSNNEQFTYTPANTVTWIAGNGDWSTASDWSGGQLPGPGDDVVIPSGVTVTHSTGTDTIHQISDTGTVILSGGTLNIDATGTLGSVDITGGTLGGTGDVTVTGDATLGGGSLTSTGTITLEGNSTLAGDVTIAGTVINDGTITWTGDGTIQLTGGTLDNEPGSTFVADSNDSPTGQTITGTGTFISDGTFDKTGSEPTTFSSGATFDSNGSVTIDSGLVTLDGGNNSGTITVDNGAGLTITGDFNFTGSSSIAGSGTIEFGPDSAGAGQVDLGGTVAATSVTIEQGATVSGQGTIDAAVTNSGTISDGGTIGVLKINGNFTQTSTGTLNLLISGMTTYDQLQISGMATLGGTLNVATTNGYRPAPNTTPSFTLLTYDALSGTFGTVNANFGAALVAPPSSQYNSTSFNEVAMATQSTDPTISPDSQTDPYLRLTPEDDRAAVVLAALVPDGQDSANDLLFTSARQESSSAGDDGVWEDVMSLEEMLTLPLRMVEAVVEAVV
jgi:hypothetical protein